MDVTELQAKLDTRFFGEVIITTEGLTASAIADNKLRLANYGVSCEYGETVMIGDIQQVENYINRELRGV